MINFNKSQRKAFATICDNIATASAVGLIIGTLVESKVLPGDTYVLVAVALIFVTFGAILRLGEN